MPSLYMDCKLLFLAFGSRAGNQEWIKPVDRWLESHPSKRYQVPPCLSKPSVLSNHLMETVLLHVITALCTLNDLSVQL